MKKRFTETQVAFVLCQAAMKYLWVYHSPEEPTKDVSLKCRCTAEGEQVPR